MAKPFRHLVWGDEPFQGDRQVNESIFFRSGLRKEAVLSSPLGQFLG